MKQKTLHLSLGRLGIRNAIFSSLCALPFLFGAQEASAQSATIVGSLGNFDVVNNTEQEAHGFEIELDGLAPNDVYYTFGSQRYGSPKVVQTATGVAVRWESTYSNGIYSQRTIAHAPNTAFAGSCYMWGTNYDQSGCEHFGTTLRANPSRTTYRWLVADTQTAGGLVPVDPPVAIPNPAWAILPPAQPAAAPVLIAEIEAPEPPEAPELYGDAQWVKIFKTELNREVSLEELVGDNPTVPQDAAHIEVEWDILQASPPSNGNQRRKRNQGSLNSDTRSVIRRYETYEYTGAYDPTTHQVVCGGDATCSAPVDGELGDYIGAQMAAVNLEIPSITVQKTGAGTVTASGAKINCGSACSATVNAGTVVTLTANPGNGIFTGWSGACSGNQLTCSVTVNAALTAGANFAAANTLSIGKSGKGTVTSSNSPINCGKTCSTKVAQGSSVTLTATPEVGQFVNWSGACSGTSPTCNVVIAKDTQVQANFK